MPEGSARELSRHLQRLQAESGRLERAGAPGAKQTSPKVEDALLRIDRFARRALLLTVYEQLSAEVVSQPKAFNTKDFQQSPFGHDLGTTPSRLESAALRILSVSGRNANENRNRNRRFERLEGRP